MTEGVAPPIFTLRGHHVGVTALTYFIESNNTYLISGDEEGDLIIWDLSIFRRLASLSKVSISRVQSLRVIKLEIEKNVHDVLVAQSRDNGVHLFDLTQILLDTSISVAKVITNFPTYGSLFSRGDAKAIDQNRAILAYPSSLENYLVAVRFLGSDAKTQISGCARRNENDPQKNCSTFDIIIKETYKKESYVLFVAYEDGCICIYTFNSESTETVPVLNCTGLKLDLVRKLDLGIKDFISAFDIVYKKEVNSYSFVVGSPLNQLLFFTCKLESADSPPETDKISLKRRGVSVVSIRPDSKLVAVAGWDNTVRLYSMESRKLLATLTNHLKQVQNILFLNKPCLDQDMDTIDNSPSDSLPSESQEVYLMCCASVEGTISISSMSTPGRAMQHPAIGASHHVTSGWYRELSSQ